MASMLRYRANQPLVAAAAAADVSETTRPNGQTTSSASSPLSASPLMQLPPEIHVLISKELIYPDALSLKHTSRHFYNLVDTGVRLKVAWLVQRREQHLDCPNDRKCNLRTDSEFCRGSVTVLMQKRRRHIECETRPGLGCLVYNTPQCAHRRDWKKRWAYRRQQITPDAWWILLAALRLLMAWLWMAEFLSWTLR